MEASSTPAPEGTTEVAAATQPVVAAAPTGRHMFSSRWTVRDILGREDGGVGLVDQEGVVAGWIRTVRFGNKGKLAFINLNDGSLITGLQIVCDSNKEGFDQLKATDCSAGASIWIFGKVVKSPAKGQTVEFLASKVALVGGCDPLTYPLAGKGHSVEFLREQAHLRARTNTFSAVARVRNGLSFATHQFFQAKGFLNVHTPLITCSDCEGAGEMFQVTTLLNNVKKPEEVARTPTGEINYAEDFFGKPSYLTVSGQLNGEYYACGLGNIYTFGPTFRAENSNTRRHLAEFWMIEPEMAFYDLVDNMDLAEAYVKHCIQHVLTTYPEDMKFLDSVYKGEGGSLLARLEHVLATPFTRITYTEAIEALLKSGAKFEEKVEWGIDMSSEHERYLTEKIYNTPVIVTDYPKDFKAFYMRLNDDGKTVAAMDVLMPTLGELIGGSQREERLDVLRARFAEHKLPEEPYKAYLDTRRFGSVPHSGFGLGFERLVLFVSGVENIRDAIPFPRYPKHAQF